MIIKVDFKHFLKRHVLNYKYFDELTSSERERWVKTIDFSMSDPSNTKQLLIEFDIACKECKVMHWDS